MTSYQLDDASRDAPARLGRYELIGHLATGGMAEIHLARLAGEAGFEKIVVVKRLLPELVASRAFVAMFLDEGKLVARLDHPNVCEVHELGREGNEYFLVMPFLDGLAVHELIARPREPDRRAELRVATAVVAQACAGLHHAHELRDADGSPAGLVHRDVSPSNLFVTSSGLVKVLDFGVAKVRGAAETEAGTIKGKTQYMAPEQLLGESLDRRADVFALGIVLFELATHQRLFKRASDYLVAKAILEEPIERADDVDPSIPRAVADVIARALSRDRAERYATAAELGAALDVTMTAYGGLANRDQIAAAITTTDELSAMRTRQHRVLDAARSRLSAATTPDLPSALSPPAPSRARTASSAPATASPRSSSPPHGASPFGASRASTPAAATPQAPSTAQRSPTSAPASSSNPIVSTSPDASSADGSSPAATAFGSTASDGAWRGSASSLDAPPTLVGRPAALPGRRRAGWVIGVGVVAGAALVAVFALRGSDKSTETNAPTSSTAGVRSTSNDARGSDSRGSEHAAELGSPAATGSARSIATPPPSSAAGSNANSTATDHANSVGAGTANPTAASSANPTSARNATSTGAGNANPTAVTGNSGAANAGVRPPAKPGTVSIDSTPFATIYIDGKRVDVTPLLGHSLAEGKHRVRAVLKDGRAKELTVDVRAGKASKPITLTW